MLLGKQKGSALELGLGDPEKVVPQEASLISERRLPGWLQSFL